jgi:polar amino acid transport system substrate-binding protein
LSHPHPLRVAASVAAALAAVALAAGCGSSSGNSSSSGGGSTASSQTSPPGAFGATKDAAIAAEVPASVRSAGSITVASDASYAPMEDVASNGSTVIGADVDLGHALGAVMGIKLNFQNVTFDAIIPGLAAGKYGLGMSSFTDTLARQKVVDFVTYFVAGTSFYVKASGGPNVGSLADLCGKSVSVENGTTEQSDAQGQSKKCTAAGKPAVTVHAYPTQTAATLALASGKDQVGMADSPVAEYIVKRSNGMFKLSGSAYGTAPYGIAVPKNSGMTKPLLDALKKLISTGVYTKILDKWGIQAGAITNPGINQATS